MSTAAGAPQSTGGGAPQSTGGGAPQSTGGAPQSTGGGGQSTGGMVGWGDDWRQRMAGGSTDVEKEVKQLERYESPEQVWKKARELERKMSAGELRTQLPKGASPEETARWRAENGIPAKPEEYKINMPAGKQAPKEDDGFLKAFMKSAHDNNYTQGQVDGALQSFYSEVERQQESISADEKKMADATEDKLRQEWGADYRTNKAMAEALLTRAPAGFRDRFMNGYLADHTPIKASAEAWKWLVQMEREINPAGTVVPGSGGDLGKTIEAEISSLKALMGNPASAYWKGPEAEKNQARYRDLVAAADKLKQKAA